jgi:small conductance mechanosensitive channel
MGMEGILSWLTAQGLQFGLRLGAALLIILGGWLLAMVAVKLADRLLAIWRFEVPQIIVEFVGKFIRVTIWAIAGIMALGQLGVNIGPLIAGFGVTGFILGFAMQQTLSNFAAGFMILLYQPYDIGHSVEIGGTKGTVEEINLTVTIMRDENNNKLIVPNGKIWGNVVRNKSIQVE